MNPYYDQDGITIYHGDCREVLLSLSFDVVLADPPYGADYRQPRAKNSNGSWVRLSVTGDERWVFDRPIVPFVVWGANNAPDYADCGWLVWDKQRYGCDLYGDGELAATDQTKKVCVFSSRWDRQHGAGWTGSHPTEKPVSLMQWCIGFLPKGVIMDPFMGGGSSLLAARIEGRRAIGIEIEERYCEIAARRLSQQVIQWDNGIQQSRESTRGLDSVSQKTLPLYPEDVP